MPQTATAATTSAFDTLLAQCRDQLRDRLCQGLAQMFDGAETTLTELADKQTDDEHKKHFLDGRDLAISNREVIESHFRQRYIAEFQKLSNKARKLATSLADFSLDDLALVAEDDLEETLKFNEMATKLSRACEQELSALDQRAGVILGDGSLESADNPFGPKAICDGYKQACQKVEAPLEIRLVWLKLFDELMTGTVKSAYQELNELLIENSILPKIRYGISKSESKAPSSAPGLPEIDKAKAAEEAPPSPQDMFAQLAKMMAPAGVAGGGAPPAPGMGVGGAPLVQGAELMGSLTQLQVGNLAALGEAAAELGPILAEAGNLKNVLHQLKTSSVGASLSQVDAMTLDVVAMLFDQLFDDPKIPIALKGLIGHLQLPMLKVAIADKELFSSKSHPARQLLDTLGQIGLRLPADFGPENPVFPRLEKFIRELVDGFQEKMEIFDKVRAELEALIKEDDARVAKDMEAAEKQLQQGERLALAKVAAEDEIKKRVGGALSVPRPIVRFLALQWIKYLVVVHARDGKDSVTWKESVETMDELLASITPRATPEERRAIVKVIPGLLKRLKSGVAASGIEDAVSSAFFSELMRCHTEVIHGTPAAPPAKSATESMTKSPVAKSPTESMTRSPVAKSPTETATKSPLKSPTETATKSPLAGKSATDTATRKPAPAVDEFDFTAPVTINNPFGEGQVAVSSEDLDFTPHTDGAPAAPALEPAKKEAKPGGAKPRDTIRLPSRIVVGAWVEVLDADGETRTPARLHYVSPMKSHFLFVDRKGKKVFECSRSMLARRIKLGEVGVLDGEPDASLFDRIMDGLFGKLGKPAPA